MKDGFNYDGVLKDLFQRDHPSLLDLMTGGAAERSRVLAQLGILSGLRGLSGR